MNALVFGADRVPRTERVSEPSPRPGEALVRVDAAGICHTDHDILHGRYPAALPRIPGHEIAGTVVGLGAGRASSPGGPSGTADRTVIEVGDRVAVDPLVTCGTCANCRRGHRNLCRRLQAYGADLDGGIAELVVVRLENLHPVGDLDAGVAALAEPLACATLGVARANPQPTDRVVVMGAGPIGLLLASALRSRGVRDVTVVDVLADRLLLARDFGATATHLATTDLVETQGPTADGTGGFDLVVDATGRPEVVQQGVRLLRDAGTLLVFGVCPPGSALVLDPHEVYARQLHVLGSFSLAGTLPAAIETLRTTDLPMRTLVTHQFPLTDAVEALQRVGTGGSLKIQVAP